MEVDRVLADPDPQPGALDPPASPSARMRQAVSSPWRNRASFWRARMAAESGSNSGARRRAPSAGVPAEIASPHFSPGAVMIAEDFGPVRVLATESIAGYGRGSTCAHGAKRPARARPAQSAIGTIIDIAAKLVKPKSFLTPTSGLVRNAG